MFDITGLLAVGGKLIDKLIPDPEAKAKAQLELATLAQSGELAKMANDTEYGLISYVSVSYTHLTLPTNREV